MMRSPLFDILRRSLLMSSISPTKPRKIAEVDDWHFETDVAIVGFGGAGACAAASVAICSPSGAGMLFCGALGGSLCGGIVEIIYHDCIGACRG